MEVTFPLFRTEEAVAVYRKSGLTLLNLLVGIVMFGAFLFHVRNLMIMEWEGWYFRITVGSLLALPIFGWKQQRLIRDTAADLVKAVRELLARRGKMAFKLSDDEVDLAAEAIRAADWADCDCNVRLVFCTSRGMKMLEVYRDIIPEGDEGTFWYIADELRQRVRPKLLHVMCDAGTRSPSEAM